MVTNAIIFKLEMGYLLALFKFFGRSFQNFCTVSNAMVTENSSDIIVIRHYYNTQHYDTKIVKCIQKI